MHACDDELHDVRIVANCEIKLAVIITDFQFSKNICRFALSPLLRAIMSAETSPLKAQTMPTSSRMSASLSKTKSATALMSARDVRTAEPIANPFHVAAVVSPRVSKESVVVLVDSDT